MTLNRRQQLEAVLEAAVAAAPRARKITFTGETLAAAGTTVLGETHGTKWWGDTLQRYRSTKKRDYTVACEGYGTSAVWTLFVVLDRPTTTRLRLSRDHAIKSAIDGVRRMFSDLDTEVLPALQDNGEPTALIEFRIDEFAVHGVNVLQAAGMDRTGAMGEVIPLANELRDRWAA